MAFEKVKIKGIRTVTKKSTGEQFHFVQVEVLTSNDILIGASDLTRLLPAYESMVGKEALIPCNWGEYNGRPSLSFADDGMPLAVPPPAQASPSTPPAPPADTQAAKASGGLFGGATK